jgi:2-keto-4-pentenoate hydratase/2-oxohepta-3-ene-1,7-dioic acid hydratase in catechol pathway
MFRLASLSGRAVLVDSDRWFDLAAVSGDDTLADPMIAIAHHVELHDIAERLAVASPGGVLADATLDVCVPRPQKVFAIGLNYRDHAAESNLALPPAPLAFTKFPSCLVGPTSLIELSGDTVDWEVEIVVVIGTGGRRIAEGDAWRHVAGLTLGQDISDRRVQTLGQPAQFSLGKSFDTFGPIGPMVVSVDTFPDPDDIGLWCSVNGERMQDARSSNLIFGIPHLVSYLSSICTLVPGDIIFTGTPSGVGAGRGHFLAVGDIVESGAELIGSMRNVCVASAVTSG